MPERSMPLMEYFDEHYRPAKLAGASCHAVCRYRTAIRKLAVCLGREPTVCDLSGDVAATFVRFIDAQAINYEMKRAMRIRYRLLWEFAAAKGVAEPPTPMPRFRPKRSARQLPPPAKGSIRHYFESNYLREPGRDLSTESQAIYRRVLARLFDARSGDLPLADSDEAALSRHAKWLAGQGRSTRAIEFDVRLLRGLFRAAGKQGLAPFVARAHRRRSLPARTSRGWSIEDIRRLFAATDQATGPGLPHCTPPQFWRAMLALGCATGARYHRLLALAPRDVDRATGVVTIGGRRFRLPAEALEALAPLIETPPHDRTLFAWRFHRKAFRYNFAKIVRAAGIRVLPCNPAGEQFGELRHIGANAIAEALGYSDGRFVATDDGYTVTAGYRLDPSAEPIVNAGWWLPDLGAEARSPPADWRSLAIASAAELLAAGDVAGGILTMSIAVDATIRRLSRRHDIRSGNPGAAPNANALATAGLIDGDDAKRLAWLAELRRRAIARPWSKAPTPSVAEAAQAIKIVRGVLARIEF